MTGLPAPQTLTNLVSTATQTFYGFPVLFNGEYRDIGEITQAITIMVPLMGQPLYIVTVSADDQGGAALASRMFNCEHDEVTPDMIEDALRELCNIVASQMTSLTAADHEVGLASRLTDNRALRDIRQSCGARLLVGAQRGEVTIGVAEFDGFN